MTAEARVVRPSLNEWIQSVVSWHQKVALFTFKKRKQAHKDSRKSQRMDEKNIVITGQEKLAGVERGCMARAKTCLLGGGLANLAEESPLPSTNFCDTLTCSAYLWSR